MTNVYRAGTKGHIVLRMRFRLLRLRMASPKDIDKCTGNSNIIRCVELSTLEQRFVLTRCMVFNKLFGWTATSLSIKELEIFALLVILAVIASGIWYALFGKFPSVHIEVTPKGNNHDNYAEFITLRRTNSYAHKR